MPPETEPIKGQDPPTPNGDPPASGDKQRKEPLGCWGTISLTQIGLLGLILAETFTKGGVSSRLKEMGHWFPPPPERPALPDETQRFTVNVELLGLLKRSLATYEEWSSFGERQLQPLLHTPQSQKTIQQLEQIGRNFLIEGVSAVQVAWLMGQTNDRVLLSADYKSLWINNDYYNLASRFEQQLAGTWIQTKTMQLEKKLQVFFMKTAEDQGELPLQIDQLQEDLKLLSWLKQRQPPITFGEETFAFFPRNEMVTVARVFQAVDRLGLHVPQSVEWCSSTCLDWRPASGIADSSTGQAKLENHVLSWSLTHELGHLISGKNRYQESFEKIRGHSGQAPAEERLKYISGYARTNTGEDFAETFMFFVMDGDYFRAVLEELDSQKPAAGKILRQKYDFLKNAVFQDAEFTTAGRARVLAFEEQEREFAGIKWSPRDRILKVQPNHQVWPEKRSLSKVFPILSEDGLIVPLVVNFNYSPQEVSYTLSLSRPESTSRITLKPLASDDRILVTANPNVVVEKGTASLVDVLSPSSEWMGPIQFKVESFSPIQKGQHRKIRDNDYPSSGRWVALRREPGVLEQDVPKVSDDQVILVMAGPEVADDEYTGKREKFWLVKVPGKENEGFLGWVSQRWIGGHFVPSGSNLP